MAIKSSCKRKDKIVKTAIHLFAHKGFDKTAIDEIVAKSGIAKGTFYLYFKSKEELIKEVSIKVMPIMSMPSLNYPYITVVYPTIEDFLFQVGKEFFDFYSKNCYGDLFIHMLSIRKRIKSIDNIYIQSYSELLRLGARAITAYVRVSFEDALLIFNIFIASLIHHLYSKESLDISESEYLKKIISVVLAYLRLSTTM